MNQGGYASADGAYRQALVFEPENVDFKLGAVKCSIANANDDNALALLDELIRLYPERENLWTLQANVYIQKSNLRRPRSAWRCCAASAKPRRRIFSCSVISIWRRKRATWRSPLTWKRLTAMATKSGEGIASTDSVSRGAWDEAKQLFAKIRATGTALAASELKLLKLEAKVAMSTGAGENAIKVLEQIVGRDPLDGEALLLAGDYYAKNDQKEKAEFRYDTAAKLSGFEADAFVKHAQLLVQSQKYVQAASCCTRRRKPSRATTSSVTWKRWNRWRGRDVPRREATQPLSHSDAFTDSVCGPERDALFFAAGKHRTSNNQHRTPMILRNFPVPVRFDVQRSTFDV